MRKPRGAPTLMGMDFGTTHTVVAAVDRGNYPVLSFERGDFVPSLVAARRSTGEVCYGTTAAARAEEDGWAVLRSVKRLLAAAGPRTTVALGGRDFLVYDLLSGYFANLKDEIYRRSNAGLRRTDRLQVAVGVPANALGSQRYLTLDAMRRAGFHVASVLNEPSAAGFEYAHRHGRTLTGKREHILVYDLGGGTFDTSLILQGKHRHEVVTSTGVARLGGDDFDDAILRLVLDEAGFLPPAGEPAAALLDECRRAKEQIEPQTRRIVIDLEALGLPPLVLPVSRVFDACQGLVEATVEAMEPVRSLLQGGDAGPRWEEVAGVYVVGGASRFPPVYRRLREIFGPHRVHRSSYPFAATAIGLAIFLDGERGFELRERLTRNFGVWRERDGGEGIFFDVIFPRDTALPADREPPLEAVRRYRAAHDIGHFRYIECSRVEGGEPSGDLLPWGQVFFPFDPALRGETELPALKVSRREGEGAEVLEQYRCSASGEIEVTITLPEDGYSKTFRVSSPSP